MKRLWRTEDWKIIGKDGLHPIMCDECQCTKEQCKDAVERFRSMHEDSKIQGVLFHKESVLTGPGTYENSPWYALEYPEPMLAASIDYGSRKIHYVDCSCETRTVDMDLMETNGDGENPVVVCSGYRAAFWPYVNPCSCLDVRELLGGGLNSTTGLMYPFNDGGRNDVYIGDDTEIELVNANGIQSTTSVYMMDRTVRDWSPYTLFAVRAGWNDSTSLFDSFDFLIMSPMPSIYVWRSNGRYISYRIRNAERYHQATNDSKNMNWCHKGFKWLRYT